MKPEYKEQLFATIQQTGVKAENFNFGSEAEDSEDICIEYLEINKPAGLKFNIKISPSFGNQFKCRKTLYCPSMKYSDWYPIRSDEYATIGDVCDALSTWIQLTLKEYISDQFEVDLWEEYKKANC